jgi:hypothetical protein
VSADLVIDFEDGPAQPRGASFEVGEFASFGHVRRARGDIPLGPRGRLEREMLAVLADLAARQP